VEVVGNNTHQVFITPNGRHLFVPCLGSDYVAQYIIDPSTAQWSANTVAPRLILKPKSGPRQLAIHSNGRFVYLLCELSSQLVTLTYDPVKGILSNPVYYSTLPSGTTGQYNAAAVRVSQNGHFVYTSNRAGLCYPFYLHSICIP
jgi:6-phosphogluconolactonase